MSLAKEVIRMAPKRVGLFFGAIEMRVRRAAWDLLDVLIEPKRRTLEELESDIHRMFFIGSRDWQELIVEIEKGEPIEMTSLQRARLKLVLAGNSYINKFGLLELIGSMGSLSALEPIVAAVQEGIEYERIEAIMAIASRNKGACALKEAIPTLLKALTSENLEVREVAIIALEYIGAKEVVGVLKNRVSCEKDEILQKQLKHTIGVLEQH